MRPERNLRRTLIASTLYAALSTHYAYAQPSIARPSTAFDRGSAMPASRFNGGIVRAQQRSGKSATEQDKPAMQPVQQMDQAPPVRPPRHSHTVMTADERRLLRQHIEEAVRDLYKR
ncbi:hypothetical protein BRCH_00555c [Candidatus Burkholderia brachyanthoides]|nr:hypothetical protein BRCH_00555c [Candidatus Burkholderia brachyanthoides]